MYIPLAYIHSTYKHFVLLQIVFLGFRCRRRCTSIAQAIPGLAALHDDFEAYTFLTCRGMWRLAAHYGLHFSEYLADLDFF